MSSSKQLSDIRAAIEAQSFDGGGTTLSEISQHLSNLLAESIATTASLISSQFESLLLAGAATTASLLASKLDTLQLTQSEILGDLNNINSNVSFLKIGDHLSRGSFASGKLSVGDNTDVIISSTRDFYELHLAVPPADASGVTFWVGGFSVAPGGALPINPGESRVFHNVNENLLKVTQNSGATRPIFYAYTYKTD